MSDDVKKERPKYDARKSQLMDDGTLRVFCKEGENFVSLKRSDLDWMEQFMDGTFESYKVEGWRLSPDGRELQREDKK